MTPSFAEFFGTVVITIVLMAGITVVILWLEHRLSMKRIEQELADKPDDSAEDFSLEFKHALFFSNQKEVEKEFKRKDRK